MAQNWFLGVLKPAELQKNVSGVGWVLKKSQIFRKRTICIVIVILQYSLLSMFLSYHRWTPLQMTIAVYIPQFSIFTNWVFYKLFYTKKENTSNLIWSKKVCHFDRHTQKETRARWENKTNCLPKYWYPIYITYSSYLRCFVHTSEFHRNTYLKTYIETCYNASFNI